MNLRTATLLGLACMTASAAASAHMIAVDHRSDALLASPIDLQVADGAAQPTVFDFRSNVTPSILLASLAPGHSLASGVDFLAGGTGNHRDEKGTWGVRVHRDHGADGAGVPATADSVPPPSTAPVSVPEPGTLGLMGIGLLLLTGFARLARGPKLPATWKSIGA